MGNRILIANFAIHIEFKQRLIECLHTMLCRAGHNLFNLVHLSLADSICNQRRIEQNLDGSASVFAIHRRY